MGETHDVGKSLRPCFLKPKGVIWERFGHTLHLAAVVKHASCPETLYPYFFYWACKDLNFGMFAEVFKDQPALN